jgi:hypothetical protein
MDSTCLLQKLVGEAWCTHSDEIPSSINCKKVFDQLKDHLVLKNNSVVT